jgi:hypothetical protein
VYHATKYMAMPSILLHDPASQCLFLRLSGYKNQKSASKGRKSLKFSDPIKKIPQPYKTRTVLFKGEYQVSGIKIRKGIGKQLTIR